MRRARTWSSISPLVILLSACTASMGDGGESLHGDTLEVPGDLGTHAEALGGGRQVVYLRFDAIRISDCDGYCSDAPSDRSFAIGAHFGVPAKDFAAYRGDRGDVVRRVRQMYEGYDVDFVTSRPASGPYTMVVVSESGGPNHGVAPLDCGNRNPNDIAFVYRIGGSSTRWIAQAVAHELGHSFGLDHVVGSGAIMHPHSSGARFTRDRFHSSRMPSHCVEGDVQDAPALLRGWLNGPARCSQVDRAAGASRFETAVAVSRRVFSRASAAVIVSGADRSAPDALAAGPLARRLGGPILLTAADGLPAPTAGELSRLGVRTVHVIGGASAVSDRVLRQLRTRGHEVVRVAGPSRFATAAEVARRVGAPDRTAFIASGADGSLVDALAASGPAARLGWPILLVTRDALPGETRAALADLGIRRTVVVGGESAVGPAVFGALPRPTRVAGPSRYETATAVGRYAVERLGVDSSHVWVARGDVMADALSAGAAGEITVLSPSGSLAGAAGRFLSDYANTATLLGGEGALSAGVMRDACRSFR